MFTKRVIKGFEKLQNNFSFDELELDDKGKIETVSLHLQEEAEQIKISSESNEREDKLSEVIENLRFEYKRKIAEAYEQGFKDAEKNLREKIKAEFDSELAEHIALLENLMKNFVGQIESFNRKVEQAVVALSIEIAKKILKKEIEENDSFVLNQVREAVRRVIGVKKIKIRVNPEDEKVVRNFKSEIFQIAETVREVVIEPDSSVDRGGCIIESELGNVDTRISTQFSTIENALSEIGNERT